MITAWTKHLPEEEKPQFERTVLAAKPVLERLHDLLSQELAGLEVAELSTKIYDLPHWEYRMADGNGFKRAIAMVNRLIDLDKGQTN